MKKSLLLLFLVIPTLLIGAAKAPKCYQGDEKLFFDEEKFVEIRQRIATQPWAAEIYKTLQHKLANPQPILEFDTSWGEGQWARDAATHYRISGEDKYLKRTCDMIVRSFNLKNPTKPLFADTTKQNTYLWSWIMYRGGLFWAYDLLRNHPLMLPYKETMNQRLDEIIAEGFRYQRGLKRLGNTQFWAITGLGIAGFMRQNQRAIDEAINGKFGFKAMLTKFRDGGRFWPEPILYSLGYVDCCMTILAEASRFNKGEDLYSYVAPNGASLPLMVQSYFTASNPDGLAFGNGDHGEYIFLEGDKVLVNGCRLFDYKGKIYRPTIKFDIYNYVLNQPYLAWAIDKNPARDAEDFEFWGYTALYYGNPTNNKKAPMATSVVYPQMGNAFIKSVEGEQYWDSECLTVHIRSGATQQFHSNNDHLHITLNKYNKNIYNDWFYRWDYLAPRKSNGHANKTPFTGRIIAHNTVSVDCREPDRSTIQLAGSAAEIEGGTFSSIERIGNTAQIISCEGEFYAGVKQKRTLCVTQEYVIDIFTLESSSPHTYDYTLHSLGEASYTGVSAWTPYEQINAQYKLAPIDSRATRANNVWLSECAITTPKGTFTVDFRDSDTIGSYTTLWGEEGTEVIRANVPYYISSKGWDELPTVAIAERKPMMVARRKATHTRFIALHQPYKGEQKRLTFSVDGDKITVSGERFTDTFDSKSTFNRTSR